MATTPTDGTETRDILDSQGNVIGSISLPTNTPEDIWTERLSVYTYIPPVPTAEETVRNAVLAAMEFGNNIIADFATGTVLSGLTDDQMLFLSQDADLLSIQSLLMTGSLRVALLRIQALSPVVDGNGNTLISQDVINTYISKIQTYLGM